MKSCDFRIYDMNWSHLKGMLRVEQTSKEHFWNKSLFREHLSGRHLGNEGYVATKDNVLVAFAAIERTGRCGHISNMVVASKFRRKGLGSSILSNLLTRIPEDLDSVEIKVRESNLSAQFLLRRSGFWCVAICRDYFADHNYDGWRYENAYCFNYDPSLDFKRSKSESILVTDRFGNVISGCISTGERTAFVGLGHRGGNG